MKRIGITQRVSTHFWGQAHDCLDASWAQLAFSLSLAPVPLPNLDAEKQVIAEYLAQCNLSGLILSGGNDISGLGNVRGSETCPVRDAFEATCIDWAIDQNTPILAVCRGFQFLNMQLGGNLTTIEGHEAARHVVHRSSGPAPNILDNYPVSLEVNSFHTYAISADDLAPDLTPLYTDIEGNVEAAHCVEKKVVGVMWHPERENPARSFDEALLRTLF